MTEYNFPVIWSRAGLKDDVYMPVHEAKDIAGKASVLLPLPLWLDLKALDYPFGNLQLGVRIEAGEPLESLRSDLAQIDLLVLDFPAFNDGRSFSKAARLRSHYGFTGEIRAGGVVRIDQVTAMLRSGFDSLQISDPLTLQRLLSGELHDTEVYYQPVAGSIAGTEKEAAGFSWRRRIC